MHGHGSEGNPRWVYEKSTSSEETSSEAIRKNPLHRGTVSDIVLPQLEQDEDLAIFNSQSGIYAVLMSEANGKQVFVSGRICYYSWQKHDKLCKFHVYIYRKEAFHIE